MTTEFRKFMALFDVFLFSSYNHIYTAVAEFNLINGSNKQSQSIDLCGCRQNNSSTFGVSLWHQSGEYWCVWGFHVCDILRFTTFQSIANRCVAANDLDRLLFSCIFTQLIMKCFVYFFLSSKNSNNTH